LIGAERGLWLANLDRERENLLAAHAWCDRADNGGEWGLRLSRAMGEYLFARGLLAVHRHVTTEALKRSGAQARTSWRARGLFDLGQIDCFMGRYAEAEVVLRESLDIARELDDERRIAEVLQPLAMAAYGTGDLARASEYLEQARDLARAMGDKRELAAALNGLAQVSRLQGRVAEAEPLYVDVVAIARETGDREILAIGLLNLSMVEIARGLAAPARDMLIEILDIAEETGSKPVGQSAFEVTAAYGALVEDWARAARFFGIAEGQIALTGYQRDPADEAFLKPFVERARVALGPPAFGDTQQAARALTYEQALGEVREWLRCG
jgi:non-specific serine/threonine protein kinase